MRVVGTAGHVDHGKSTLIRALTGIDPDRLQEEKERGMTIDLGFAWLRLPSGLEVSIVDVPGHERFVHNMLAGVGGIDIALLVVAADEGIMPQTREHLAILDLLGISQGVVALTKRDLVDDEWLELVQADVEDCLAGTSLAGAPIVPCSATTGVGLDQLLAVLQRLLEHERLRPSTGRPRLPIDRVFTVAGFGTVVTGTLLDGELRLGQELEVQPGGLRTRVRGLQTHKRRAERVEAGTRTAVNLVGVAVEQLARGQVLSPPGALLPTRAVDARLRLIKGARPLKHNAELSFHTGAAETLARLSLLDRDSLEPEQEAWVQLRLQDEVALARGDLFVVRLPSPSMTVGGGSVVEPHARRHRRRQPAVLERLAVLARGAPAEVLLQQLRTQEPAELGELVRRSGLPAEASQEAVAELVRTEQVLTLDGTGGAAARVDARTLLVSASGWRALVERVESILGAYHRGFPLRRGLPKEELRTRLGTGPRSFGRILERLEAEGVAAEDGPFVRLAGHAVRFDPSQTRQVETLLAMLREAGVAPPDRSEWEAELGISPELTDALLAQGRLVEVAPELLYERETLERLIADIRAALERSGSLTVAQLRDLLGASRKYALPLLGYTDEHHITRRVGDTRVLY
jgi:selenocysteine-specific elongation factor